MLFTWYKSCQVAAISGDARRALEICRRAAEITDYRIKKSLTSNTSMNGINSYVLKFGITRYFIANIVPNKNWKPNLSYQIFCCF